MTDSEDLSEPVSFHDVNWNDVPASPGVYVIYDHDEVIYVGMSGRNGKGNLRNRLRDHCSGQVVNICSRSIYSWLVSSFSPVNESPTLGTPRLRAISTSSAGARFVIRCRRTRREPGTWRTNSRRH
jgi:hypothetical protein